VSGFEAVLPYLYAAAAATAAVGTVSAAQAQAASARSSAAASDYNAQVAAQNADIARRNAGAREDAQRRESRSLLAKQRAAAAQSGFDPASGTLGLVQEQSADNAEVDALMVRYSGELEARGYGAQGALDRFTAGALRANASATSRGGYIGAAAGLLSAAASYRRPAAKGSTFTYTGYGAGGDPQYG
jgi:hypothetical protein